MSRFITERTVINVDTFNTPHDSRTPNASVIGEFVAIFALTFLIAVSYEIVRHVA